MPPTNQWFGFWHPALQFRRWRRGMALSFLLVSIAAAFSQSQLLSEREAYDEIVRAVSEQLSKPDRFTRLPHNISDLSVAPDRKPIFSILIGSKAEEFKSGARAQAYLKDEGQFIVSRFGTVAASFEDQIVLQRQIEGQQNSFAMCGPSNVRRRDFPSYVSVKRVFRAGSDWGIIFSDGIKSGIKLDSSTNLQMTLTNRFFPAHVIETEKGIIAVTRPDDSTGYDTNSHLVVTVKDERGTRQSMFRDYRLVQLHLQGLLPLNDGRFVAIAERLVVLREDAPVAPTDAEQAALLTAFEKQDREQFNEAVRVVSEYPPNQLRQVDRQLQSVRDPAEAYVGIELGARSLLEHIGRSEPKLTAATNQELNLALQAHQETARDFVRRLDKLRGGKLGIAPKRVVELLRSGWQYFGGYWVQHPKLIQQIATTAVVLELEFRDADWNPARGVFRLDKTGRLELLFQHERDGFTPPCQFFRTATGEELVFFPFEGLARYANGKLEWLDRSDEMKWLERVIGCDREGRIYFGSGPSAVSANQSGSFGRTPSGYAIWAAFGRGSADFWVYRPKAERASSPIVRLFPVAHTPVMDRSNRIWFCPTLQPQFALPPETGTLTRSRAAELARAELTTAPQRPMNVKLLSEPFPRTFGAAEIAAQLDLFCYDDGRVSRCLTNLPLSTTLLAGNAGAIIGITQDRSDRRAFVVENGESATLATDLHELAVKDFSTLLRAAPLQSEPPGFAYHNQVIHQVDYNPSLCRVEDRLWINDHDKVEVYQDGKSLAFQMKLTIPSRMLALLGPVTSPAGDKRMLVFAPSIAEGNSSTALASLVWAAASAEGELLGVDRLSTTRSWDMPVFNRANGAFFLADAGNRCWIVSGPKESKRLGDLGDPVLALQNGDWIAQGTAYAGYRVVSGEQVEDIAASCSRPFVILAEIEDGRLLCSTPEGLLWLARERGGKFKVSEEMPLHTGGFAFSYVGQDTHHLYLSFSDARRQAYLAVIEKKSPAR